MSDLPTHEQITELFKLIHEVFPLPVDSSFRGTHHIGLFKHDAGETLDRQWLEDLKEAIKAADSV